MPGATTASEVFCEIAICSKATLMPQTVPKSPTKGAVDPTVARNGRPRVRLSVALEIATSIDRSIRACAPAMSSPLSRWLRRHSTMPDAKMRSLDPSGCAPIWSKSSSRGSPDQKARSKTAASRRAWRKEMNFCTMIAQDQKLATVRRIITILTMKDARQKSASREKSISCAIEMVWVSMNVCSPVEATFSRIC